MINAKRQREKREFEEFLEVLRRGETLIEKYCRAIRNQPAFFEMTFEEYEKAWDERKKMLKIEQIDDNAFNNFFSENP
jgi:spore coat polysaccharide biosynthesis protein SpsF (cytidylyltransferase family)